MAVMQENYVAQDLFEWKAQKNFLIQFHRKSWKSRKKNLFQVNGENTNYFVLSLILNMIFSQVCPRSITLIKRAPVY